MSYILDSLKKSDQERHSTQPNATEPLAALHDNYLTSTDKEAPFWSTWLIALVVLFFIVGLLLSDQYFFPINSVENDIGSLGGGDQALSQNIENSPAIDDHRIEGAAQIAEVPPIVKASQAIVEDVQAGSVLRGRGEIEKPEMPLIKKENIAEVSSAVDTLYQQTGVEEKTSIDTLYENDGVAEVEAIKESIVVKSANQ